MSLNATPLSFDDGTRTLPIFDFETTGPDPQVHRIVQYAVLLVHADGTTESVMGYVDPEVAIPPDATKVHGITYVQVMGAPSIAEAAEVFMPPLHTPGGAVTGYHSRSFDAPMVDRQLAEAGSALRTPKAHLDVIDLVRWHLRHLRGRKLLDLCTFLRVTAHDLHSALGDVQATWGVLQAMVVRGIVPASLTALRAQAAIVGPYLDAEWDRFTWHFYVRNGQLFIGFGQYIGRLARDVRPDYYAHVLGKTDSRPSELPVPPEARRLLEDLADGKSTSWVDLTTPDVPVYRRD